MFSVRAEQPYNEAREGPFCVIPSDVSPSPLADNALFFEEPGFPRPLIHGRPSQTERNECAGSRFIFWLPKASRFHEKTVHTSPHLFSVLLVDRNSDKREVFGKPCKIHIQNDNRAEIWHPGARVSAQSRALRASPTEAGPGMAQHKPHMND